MIQRVDGLRVKKTATSTGTTEYTLHGKNIVHMTQGSNTLHFYYDAQDKPCIVIFNGTAYGYLYNLQGDVAALVNGSGTKVVEYGYDAWGKPTSRTGTLANTLGKIQPFRYRGYVYDEETGDYYLRSRYYRAGWGRFVSADAAISEYTTVNVTRSEHKALFVYCNDNPVGCIDSDGEWFHFLVGAVIGAVIGVVSSIVSGGDLVDVVISGVAGAAGGVLAASGAPMGWEIVGNAAISMASNAGQQVNHIIQGDSEEFDVGSMVFDGAVGAVAGALGGKGASNGNTAGIKASGNKLLKNGLFGITKKSWRYYATQAHRQGGDFVIHELAKSLRWSAGANAISAGKARLCLD